MPITAVRGSSIAWQAVRLAAILVVASTALGACAEYEPNPTTGPAAGVQPEATPTYDPHERFATPDPNVTLPDKLDGRGEQPTPIIPAPEDPDSVDVHVHPASPSW